MKITQLETDRLLLRQWREQDFPIFAKLNSDPKVMAYYPKLLNREESDATARRYKALISERGWGFWALELKRSSEFIGFVGLHACKPVLPFFPCVEIGWRLVRRCWRHGYATEAANESLRYAFEALGLSEVVSFTTVSNVRSRAVMERLGLKNTHQNFKHPNIPKGHVLSEHVLYKITKANWQAH